MKPTILSDYILDGNIDIPADDFAKLNESFTQDEIKDAFVTEILENNSIDLPTKPISKQEAADDFLALCDYKTNGIQDGAAFSRYEYDVNLDNAFFWETTIGSVASDYFHQDARYKAASQSEMSPYAVWHTEKSLRSALNPLWTLKMEQVNRTRLRSCISLRKYIASQFRPAIAKAVYEYFDAKNVLDFSAGWGDRLAGFYAASCTESYIGVDPNPLVIEQYPKQVDFYAALSNKKQCSFFQKPAEEMSYEKDSVDLVFTSPPYFIAERYRYGIKDMAQSSVRYNRVEKWLGGFLCPAIENAWNALQSGGHLVLNISDIYAKNRGNYHARYCDDMHRFITEKLGGKFIRLVGMKMHKRPNCHSFENKNIPNDASFCEPVWIYQKTN